MKSPITHITIPIDYCYLTNLYNSTKLSQFLYKDTPIENLYISKLDNDPYIQSIFKEIGAEGSARFLMIPAKSKLFIHKDHNTLCSLNVILNDVLDPILFGESAPFTEYTYKQAILDTTQFHHVKTSTQDRIIFKLSFFNNTYTEIKNLCRKWIQD